MPTSSRLRRVLHGCAAASGALGMALLCFLVLPLLQATSAGPVADLSVTSLETVTLPPPPTPDVEPEQPKTAENEPPPPALVDEAPPLDLAQLELALNPAMAGLDGVGDIAIKIAAAFGAGAVDQLFSLADLDQKPRAIFQQQPVLSAALRKRVPATVNVVFTVDQSGRVEAPVVQNSSDTAFEAPVLAAIKQWRFEPGKRGGQPVRFRMRQPMSFQ